MGQPVSHPAPACRRCNVGMEKGFRIDHAHADMMIKQERWVAGDARPPSFFAGTETSGGQEVSAIKVITYRCPNCGYLESYAPAQS